MSHFDRFDVCEAYFVFASNHHRGMASKEYRIFSRLKGIAFKPRPSLSATTLNDNARSIFDALVESSKP